MILGSVKDHQIALLNSCVVIKRSLRSRCLVTFRKILGSLIALNFAVLWLAPVIIQGLSFRHGFGQVIRPAYRLIDRSSAIRRFAAKFIYCKSAHVDYFAASVLLIISSLVILSSVFTWQIVHGSLPWWLVVVYYFMWVGPGGRSIATAWTLAHREGHESRRGVYRPWMSDRVGNFFENWLGVFYGSVPYTFSTSHLLLHHRLDSGKGDPVYMWDIDRTRFADLMLYQWRFLKYMTGISSLVEFRRASGVVPAIDRARVTLRRGVAIYWIWVPGSILALLIGTGSSLDSALLFLFLIYLQPLLAMSTFLSIINVGQHGFLEFDESGRHVTHVTSTTILDGLDDSFGEDYHVAHHYFPRVDRDGLKEHAVRERSTWARCAGAVFKDTTIFEMSFMIQFGRFEQLVQNHYVDYNESGNIDELAALFKRRAKRKEMSYEEYEFHYLPYLRQHSRELVRRGTCKDENRAYVYQAHHNLQSDLIVRLNGI